MGRILIIISILIPLLLILVVGLYILYKIHIFIAVGTVLFIVLKLVKIFIDDDFEVKFDLDEKD